MMRRSTKESPNVSIRRQLRFVRCPVCTKFQKSQKLSDHMQRFHKMKPTKTDSEETLMICPEHKPFQYINTHKARPSQIQDFVKAHGGHLKSNRKLNRLERQQVDEFFNREFDADRMHPDLVEVFQISSDEDNVTSPPPPKRDRKPKRNYNVDLDYNTSPVPGPSSYPTIGLPNPEDLATAVATALPPPPYEFDALYEAAKAADITNWLDTSLSLNMPLKTLQTMLFTEHETPGEMQQEYINTFVPGLVNPPTLETAPLLTRDTAVGTPPPLRINAITETIPTSNIETSTNTQAASVTDAAVDPKPFFTKEKGVGDSDVYTNDRATSPHDFTDDGPVIENSYDYIRSINDMKNQMIRQLLEDNIAMAQTKQNSRIRALKHLDDMLQLKQEDRDRVNPYDVNSMDMFSDIFKVKERFIHQLLRENVQSHPQHYKLYELLKTLH